MSKFLNTSHKVTIDSLVDGFKEKIKNPYHIHQDKQPTLTTYYNQDIHKSTLDEGFKTQYSSLGNNSPIRYNKINNFYVYGFERIAIELDNGEFGLESSGIEGEVIILPNTIIPIANDYFTINHSNKKLLFKVISVSVNTIENGSNFYKIEYKLDQFDDNEIEKLVDNSFEMVINNVGTQFNSIIRTNDYNYIDKVEDILERLKTYYCNLFYSQRVQTFIFNYNDTYFYDPYMIEFLKKHNLISTEKEYIHIAHQTFIPATFSLEYDKTFFRFTECPDLKGLKPRVHSHADIVDEYLSILCTRAEDYYKIKYIKTNQSNPNCYIIKNYDLDLLEKIYSNNLYEDSNYLNILIKYFNNEKITSDDIYTIEQIDFEHELSLFYNIPILIYILEYNVKSILRTNK